MDLGLDFGADTCSLRSRDSALDQNRINAVYKVFDRLGDFDWVSFFDCHGVVYLCLVVFGWSKRAVGSWCGTESQIPRLRVGL
jgi:hypothetical protein